MKIIILILISYFSFNIQAGQFGSNTYSDKGLKDFYAKRNLIEVSKSISFYEENSNESLKLIEQVSNFLNLKITDSYNKNKNVDPIDYDLCSGKCRELNNGQNDKDLKLCFKSCKAFQLESFAFINGMLFSKSQKNVNDDCSSASVNSERKTFFDKLSKDPTYLENKIKDFKK
jgi:DNA-binding XRE family transcriptional regulator